jgi:hypothetical protein
MSRFRVAPRKGHLDRLKRIYGYLKQFRNGAIRVRMEQPEYDHLQDEVYDWAYSVYGNVEESIPPDLPEPKGKGVVTTTYVDANLYHDLTSGRAVT